MNITELKRNFIDSNGEGSININGCVVPVKVRRINVGYHDFKPEVELACIAREGIETTFANGIAYKFQIERVIFAKPATIVFWKDGTKTVVKTQRKEKYDPEKGLAMAIAKRALGDKGSYFNEIKKVHHGREQLRKRESEEELKEKIKRGHINGHICI
jgi:hypothetical protein